MKTIYFIVLLIAFAFAFAALLPGKAEGVYAFAGLTFTLVYIVVAGRAGRQNVK